MEQLLVSGPVLERMIEDRVRNFVRKEIRARLPGNDRQGHQHQCQDQSRQNTQSGLNYGRTQANRRNARSGDTPSAALASLRIQASKVPSSSSSFS